MNIKIKNQTIELKNSIRSLLLFENITDTTYTGKNISENIVLMYCIVITSSKIDLTLEEFINWIDENQDTFSEMVQWYVQDITKQNSLSGKIKKKKLRME